MVACQGLLSPSVLLTAAAYSLALVPGRSATSYSPRFAAAATPGSVCVLPNSTGSLSGSNTSPAMRTVTCVCGSVFTVAVSPTARPLWLRNAVLTSTSPGASYQWPAIIP